MLLILNDKMSYENQHKKDKANDSVKETSDNKQTYIR